jgi:UDP-N-acetylmuramyl pentapeptide phosphotransferase/UDP-N-acetylglucosamine-1-phosphate transferase
LPTPQGGGIAVMTATIIVTLAAAWLMGDSGEYLIGWVLVAAAFIAIVGAVDDIRTVPVLPKFLLQAAAAAVVVFALPGELRLLAGVPVVVERLLLLLALLWFVNLVNFMDGIDLITAAEVAPLTAALAAFGFFGALPRDATLIAFALCGATIGFAYFNKPVAQLFLGDVGSLPMGLLLGWLLLLLGMSGHVTAAVLLPLYYLADATITLFRRLARGERVWQAHRSHFYQRAAHGALSVTQVVVRVFIVNVALIALAASTLVTQTHLAHALALAIGCVLVALLLYGFERAGAAAKA